MKPALLVLVAACGTIGMQPHDTPMSPDAALPDSPVVSQPDAALPHFGVPVALDGLNQASSNEEWAALTGDLLEIVFASDRAGGAGGWDLWTATRPTTSSAWSIPVTIPPIDTSGDETHVALSQDGLQLYFSTALPNSTSAADLFVSTRATRSSAWSAPVPVDELNSIASESGSSISEDGLTIAFDSNRGGASGRDIYLASRTDHAAAWGIPVSVSAINTVDLEANPTLANDSRLMWFEQGSTIMTTTRTDRSSEFGPPTAVTDVDWATGDHQVWLSDDERTVVFTRVNNNQTDLYMATR